MSDEIKPALTAEEWSGEDSIAIGHASGKMGWFIPIADSWRTAGELVLELRSTPSQNTDWPIDDRHALAAICLYQQPFGFTHDDVITLEEWSRPMADSRNVFARIAAQHILQIAGKIAALLPLEKP